jgi:hypothetical protein
MAKILVHDDCIDIRFGLLERMMLSERSRRLPLASVRKVDPHPPLLDMMMHWADQGSVWMCGVSSYEGHMIPSARNPRSTLAIELSDEPQIFVEVDDEAPEQTAERISRAMGSEPPPARMAEQSSVPDGALTLSAASSARFCSRADPRASTERDALEIIVDDDPDFADEGRQAAPPPERGREPPAELHLDDDRDLARLGGWLLGLGSLGVLTGVVIVAAGAIPGLLAAGAGLACAVLGGVALAVVAHHSG